MDLIREILQSLSTNKLRTALTGFAVAWGIFMLIVLLGLANGIVHSFEANVKGFNPNALTVYWGRTSLPYKGYQPGRRIALEEGDMKAIDESDREHITSTATRVSNDTVRFVSTTEVASQQGFTGVYPSALADDNVTMIAGRFLNDADMRGAQKVLVVGKETATELYGSPEAAVGKIVNGMALAWKIVGVYEHGWRRDTYAPYTTTVKLGGNTNEVNSITVQFQGLKTGGDGMELEQKVRTALAQNHSFDPQDQSAVYIRNSFTQYLSMEQAMDILIYSMWVIGLLTMLSGIIGVSNIMFVSVRERTHELGIRRAIGAKPRQILMQIVIESVVITTVFGYIGIVMGTAVMALINSLIGTSLEMLQNPTVDLKVAIQVTVVLIIAGACAGLFPAVKATKIKPVEALADE